MSTFFCASPGHGHASWYLFSYRYIFNTKVPGFIAKAEMALEMTTSCIRYLCESHHDPNTTRDEIEGWISDGAYVLHTFAETTWLSLVERCVRLSGPDTLPPDLLEALGKFLGERYAGESEGASSPEDKTYQPELQRFREAAPEIYHFLSQAAEFRRTCSASEFHMNQGEAPRRVACQQLLMMYR